MKIRITLLLFTVLITACCLFSCEEPADSTEYPKAIMRITDFPQFENLTRNPQKIIVDLSEPYSVSFEITSEEHIDEIVDILFNNTTYEKFVLDYDTVPKTLRFVDEEGNESEAIGGQIEYLDRRFVPYHKDESRTLWSAIIAIGKELGTIEDYVPNENSYAPMSESMSSFPGLHTSDNPQKITVSLNEPYNVTFDITDEEYISTIVRILYDKTVYILIDKDVIPYIPDKKAEIYFIDGEGAISHAVGATYLKYYERYYTYIIPSGEPSLHSTLLRIAKEMGQIE